MGGHVEGDAVLYIDVLFFARLTADVFLLWAAGRLADVRVKKSRLFFGGLLSASVSLAYLVWFGKEGGTGLLLLLMILGLFGTYVPRRGRVLLRVFFSEWLTAFLLSGAVTAVLRFPGAQKLWRYGVLSGFPVLPWQILLWSIAVSCILLRAGGKWIEAHLSKRQEYCTFLIRNGTRKAEGRALIDTGNGLRHKDGRGVAVLELSAVLSLFSAEEGGSLLAGDVSLLESIPFASLGNPEGRLWGFRAEEFRLFFGGRQTVHRNIFTGISFDLFSGAYEGIIPTSLSEEEGL